MKSQAVWLCLILCAGCAADSSPEPDSSPPASPGTAGASTEATTTSASHGDVAPPRGPVSIPETPPAVPRVEPGLVAPGEPVRLVVDETSGVGFTLSRLDSDGRFVTEWGLVGSGNAEGNPSFSVTDDLSRFGYEDVGVSPDADQLLPTPADAPAGVYILCPDNTPDLECFLLGIDEVDEDDLRRCGPLCTGRELGSAIPVPDFQPAIGFTEGDVLTIHLPLNRSRPDTYLLETRTDGAAGWEPQVALVSFEYGLTEPDPIQTAVEVVDGGTPSWGYIESGANPVGDTWTLPSLPADTEARVCSVEPLRMSCVYL